MRSGFRWTAEYRPGNWQIQIDEPDYLGTVEVDVDKIARNGADYDADVLAGPEQSRQILGPRPEILPTADYRPLLAGRHRHDAPTAPVIFAHSVEPGHRA